ncbi:MAG: hypothetical protein P1P65_05415 [Treponema sp.]
MKKLIAVLTVTVFFTGLIFCEEAAKESDKVRYAAHITAAVTFPLGAQLNVSEVIKVPVMNFNTALTRGNNIAFKIGAELTPITLEGKFDIIWTPIAFLELYAGAGIGSGWTIKKLHGLSVTTADASGRTVKTPVNFKRPFYSVNFGGAFQFDLGALIPTPWTHVVFRIDQYALYRGLAGVDRYASWIYKNDAGMNRNGFTYCGTYLIGYQMPLPLSLIALRVETEKTFYAVPSGLDKRDWGEDQYYVAFGPVLNFTAAKILNIMLVAQWETLLSYKEADRFYQNQKIDRNKKPLIGFKRVGVIFDIKIPHN